MAVHSRVLKLHNRDVKVVALDYQRLFVDLAGKDDLVCIELSKAQLAAIQGYIEPMRWRTRWYNTATYDQNVLDAWIADLELRLMVEGACDVAYALNCDNGVVSLLADGVPISTIDLAECGVVGPQGPPGADGAPGAPGAPGADGVDAVIPYSHLVFDHFHTSWPWQGAESFGDWTNTSAWMMTVEGTPPGDSWRLKMECEVNEQVTLRKLKVLVNLAPSSIRLDQINWQLYLQRVVHTSDQSDTTLQSGAELIDEGFWADDFDPDGGNWELEFTLDRRHTNTGTGYNFVFELFTAFEPIGEGSPASVIKTEFLIDGLPVSWVASRADSVSIVNANVVDWT